MEVENDPQGMEELNKLVRSIVDECKHIQGTVGRGLYASVYRQMLYQALLQKGMFVQRQVPVYTPEEYQQVQVDMKAELVVENSVICDIKCVDSILQIIMPQHHGSNGAVWPPLITNVNQVFFGNMGKAFYFFDSFYQSKIAKWKNIKALQGVQQVNINRPVTNTF